VEIYNVKIAKTRRFAYEENVICHMCTNQTTQCETEQIGSCKVLRHKALTVSLLSDNLIVFLCNIHIIQLNVIL